MDGRVRISATVHSTACPTPGTHPVVDRKREHRKKQLCGSKKMVYTCTYEHEREDVQTASYSQCLQGLPFTRLTDRQASGD